MSTTTSTGVNANLKTLTDAGVSVWLDQISTTLLAGGELARMVAQDSLRGVTSNPSIFEKAIVATTDYDDLIETLAGQGEDARAIYDAIAVGDVQRASDVLRPVFEGSGGHDGFVSLEVQPDLAADGDATLESARSYWGAVDRPNVMIKIPGTPEGVGAIEQAIYEGLNINVTLLFSVAAYQAIAEAYIRGLERRRAEGKPLHPRSVASFFVSRVDTKVDKQLEAIGGDATALAGTAAIANARHAYARFKEIFAGERWDTLAAAGAAVQRPLWASTGTKNPAYSDTLYIDQLIAPHTVNTMPLTTLRAVADHGTVVGTTAELDYAADLAALERVGIDMEKVTAELLVEGVKQFVDAQTSLLAGIEQRRAAIAQR